eukprot:SAG31_NODE_13730_length_851_cov_0.662234_1_plen_39_part_01
MFKVNTFYFVSQAKYLYLDLIIPIPRGIGMVKFKISNAI